MSNKIRPSVSVLSTALFSILMSLSPSVVHARAIIHPSNLTRTAYGELKACVRSAKSMPNLDFQKLEGVWYTETANQANDMVSCAMTRYDAVEGDEDRLLVTKFVQFRSGERQLLRPTVGWRVPASNSLVMVHEGPTKQDSVALMTYIVDTDYNNYVVVYTCGLLGTGDVIRTAHVMTRTAEPLDSEQRNAIVNYSLEELASSQRTIGKESCPLVAQTPLGQMANK